MNPLIRTNRICSRMHSSGKNSIHHPIKGCSAQTTRSYKRNFAEKSRLDKIRDRNFKYPKSTDNKIVFISNKTGNGFKN